MDRTDSLIVELSTALPPVERLRPPMVRAGLWLLAVAALAAAMIAQFADVDEFVARAADTSVAAEAAGTLLTGLLAVIAAFQLSLPDRSWRWAMLPLPAFVVWLASSGYNCWQNWLSTGPAGLVIGESAECFLWILTFGIPLGAALMFALRRARPINPTLPVVIGALGVAALAGFLLQFFHPFDVTFMDLGLHLAAAGFVAVLATRSSTVVFAD